MRKYLFLLILMATGVETATADKILLENGDLIKQNFAGEWGSDQGQSGKCEIRCSDDDHWLL